MPRVIRLIVLIAILTLLYGIANAESMSELVAAPWWNAHSSERFYKMWNDRVIGVTFGDEAILVRIEMKTYNSVNRMTFYWSPNTVLQIDGKTFPFIGHWEASVGFYFVCDAQGYTQGRGWGWDNPQQGESYTYNMVFKGHYEGEPSSFSIVDDQPYGEAKAYGGSFKNVPIEVKPSADYPKMTDDYLKKCVVEQGDIAGIYQSIGDNPWKLGCFKNTSNEWVLINLDNVNHPWWAKYETKAFLDRTASPNTWMATVYDDQKDKAKGCIAVFEGAALTITSNRNIDYRNNKMLFVKMYPNARDAAQSKGDALNGGSGFPLKDGYIVTNYHVVKDNDWVDVYLDGHKARATIAFTDKKNDIAVLHTSLDTSDLPYGVQVRSQDIGDKVFAFGYPLTSTMGKNVKLTEGIVNSLTGFEDDETMYQISAAVQPGNSGGPLFNSKGAIIGIVSAKHLGAENVNYAIKASYLKTLLENRGMAHIIPNVKIGFSSFSDKISTLKKYVCRLECGKN